MELLCHLLCSSHCMSLLASGLQVFGSINVVEKGLSGGIKQFHFLFCFLFIRKGKMLTVVLFQRSS